MTAEPRHQPMASLGGFRQFLHLARRDLRRARWIAAGWIAVVVVLVGAEWAARSVGMLLPGTGFLLFFGAAVLAAWLVQGDPPRREEAYWATLPLDPLALLAAKAAVAFVVGGGIPLLGHAVALQFWDLEPAWLLRGVVRGALGVGAGVTLGLVIGAATTSLAGAAALVFGSVATIVGIAALHTVVVTAGMDAPAPAGPTVPHGMRSLIFGPGGALLAALYLVVLYHRGWTGWGARLVAGILVLGCLGTGIHVSSPAEPGGPDRTFQSEAWDARYPPPVRGDAFRVLAAEWLSQGTPRDAADQPRPRPQAVALRLSGPDPEAREVRSFLGLGFRLVTHPGGEVTRVNEGWTSRPRDATAGTLGPQPHTRRHSDPIVEFSPEEWEALRTDELRLELLGWDLRSALLDLPTVPVHDALRGGVARAFPGGRLLLVEAPLGAEPGPFSVIGPPSHALRLTLTLTEPVARSVGLVQIGVPFTAQSWSQALVVDGEATSPGHLNRRGSFGFGGGGAGILPGVTTSLRGYDVFLPASHGPLGTDAELRLVYWDLDAAERVRIPVPHEVWGTLRGPEEEGR